MKKNKLTTITPSQIAEKAGLEYVSDQEAGFKRKGFPKNFKYLDIKGKVIKNPEIIQRIHSLAIPPAYTDVWICANPNGHLQATGRDAKGRKQYRYHPQWRQTCDETKYNKMAAFGQALPQIRKKVGEDLSLSGLPKDKILATLIQLLDETLIRIGNEEYAKANDSFGLTTFKNRHVDISGTKIIFQFKGKSGKIHKITLNNPRLAKIIKRCKELPGQELFQYINDNQEYVSISSTDVNAYLRNIANDNFTAKDFRTWYGSVLTVFELMQLPPFSCENEAKKNIVAVIETVSKKLGNTSAICRKSYIHPEILLAYLEKNLEESLISKVKKSIHNLNSHEIKFINFLINRCSKH